MVLSSLPRRLAQAGDLYQQLNHLTAAGIGLPQALAIQHESPPARWLRIPLRQLITRLETGCTFGDALKALSRRWPPAFDVAMLQAGEQSGSLPECFQLLAGYYHEHARLMRNVSADLAYPVLLLHLAIFIGPFPSLLLTGNLGAYLGQTLGILAPIYLATGAILYAAQSGHAESWRSVVESIERAIPVWGSARRDLALARLTAALEALIRAGISIIDAWDLAADASGSPALRRQVRGWKPKVLAGVTPAEAVTASGHFPELFANLYHTGEISGRLDESLRQLHRIYQDNATRKLRLFAEWTPKLIYFAVMLMIAWRVVSFWTAHFRQIGDVLQ